MVHNFKNIFMNSLMISLIAFGSYSFTSLVPPRSTPISHPLNCFPLIFLKPTHSYWCCLCTLRSAAIHWSMLDLTGASPLKKVLMFPFPEAVSYWKLLSWGETLFPLLHSMLEFCLLQPMCIHMCDFLVVSRKLSLTTCGSYTLWFLF